jgi:hypothetical protein
MATAANTTEITFQTGPYGEIFPLPLLAGMTDEEALDRLVEDSAEAGYPFDPPTRGQYVDEMHFRGQIHVHQQRLPQALAGEMDLPEAEALRIAVMEQGHPMSLRPFGMEVLNYRSFAPVLKYLGKGHWQIGLEDEGRTYTFEETDVVQAIKAAQQIFKKWADNDDGNWMEAAEQAMQDYPRSLFHHYWTAQIRRDRVWNRGGGVVLHLQDNHSPGRFRLDLPGDAVRLYKTSRVRGVHIADAVARANDIKPDFPPSSVVMEWLLDEGMAFPEMDDPYHWTVGDVRVKVDQDNGRIVLITGEGDNRCGYLIARDKGRHGHPQLALYEGKSGGRPDTSKTLAKTAWEDPFKQWMQQDTGRMALSMWFIHKAQLGGKQSKD